MTFQQTLNRDIPQAVAGDFASTNPRYSMLAGEGELRTAEPITVGRFAFADPDTGLVSQAFSAGMKAGFVHRNNQAIVPLGQSASMIIPAGREIALFTSADFWAVFSTSVTAGAPVYAAEDDGSPTVSSTDAQATLFTVSKSAAAGELVKITVAG